MSEDFPIDILIVAMVALFIFLHLRRVLGRRTGHERPPPDAVARQGQTADDNVIQLSDRGEDEGALDPALENSPAAAGLHAIRDADRSFDPMGFLSGARAAYEMIVTAFADGDSKTLRPLLSDEVYGNFVGAIEDRESREQTLDRTLVGIKAADFVEARLSGRVAEVTIKFVSEVLNVTRDKTGEVVDGDPKAVREVTDVWTFSRNTRSSNPNWTLVETRSGH
jgi:predicted lipid-binding transport protein (Tim44 family)